MALQLFLIIIRKSQWCNFYFDTLELLEQAKLEDESYQIWVYTLWIFKSLESSEKISNQSLIIGSGPYVYSLFQGHPCLCRNQLFSERFLMENELFIFVVENDYLNKCLCAQFDKCNWNRIIDELHWRR